MAGCGVVVDRHVPKNGGSSVRTMLRAPAQRCVYAGYDLSASWPSRVGFNHTSFSRLSAALRSGRGASRVCLEAHVVGESFWSELTELKRSPFALRCRVLLLLRVREPLSWYISFFDWAVLPRLQGREADYGVNFTDWLPSDLQSRVLLSSSSQGVVRMATRRSGANVSWRSLQQILRLADVAAPLERCTCNPPPRASSHARPAAHPCPISPHQL